MNIFHLILDRKIIKMAILPSDPFLPFQPTIEKVWVSIDICHNWQSNSVLLDPYRRETIEKLEKYYGSVIEYYFYKDKVYLLVAGIEKATEIHNTKNSYIAIRSPLNSKLFDKPNLSGKWLVYMKQSNCYRDEIFDYLKKFGVIDMYGYKKENNSMYIRFKNNADQINAITDNKFAISGITIL